MKSRFYLHRFGAELFLRVLSRHNRIEHTNTKAKAQCKYNINLNVYVNSMSVSGDVVERKIDVRE